MDRRTACKEFFRVDRKMLPIKFHFLLSSLGLSAVLSFFPIMGKYAGMSATGVGLIYTVCPFTSVLINPLFGWITDKVQRVKLVMIIMIIVQTPLLFGIVFVPPLPKETSSFSAELSCSSNNYFLMSAEFFTLLPNNKSLICSSNCSECLHMANNTSDEVALCGNNIMMKTQEIHNFSCEFLKVTNISVRGRELSPYCYEEPSNKCHTMCGLERRNEVKNEFATYQFWTLFFLMVISLALVNCGIVIGDAACYEALEGRVNMYGKQRVWLSVGWGLGTLATGYLLDVVNPNQEKKTDFTFCAYIMLTMTVFDLIALSQATIKKPEASENIFKDVGKIFARPHPIIFASAALVIGAIDGIMANYQFWYLEGLGASKLLLGLSAAVFCFLVESQFLFISGWVVKRIGRDNSVVLSFSTYSFWFIVLSFIYNPWWILLINLTQGPSFGLYFVAMTSYGKIATAPGTEATMQTVLSAIFRGLGLGSGCLLGGLGIDAYGERITFRSIGILAVCGGIIYKLLTVFVAGEDTAIVQGGPGTTDAVTDKKKPHQEIYSIK